MPIKKSDKKLLKELIDKGYGEDERKKRLEIYKKKIHGKAAKQQNKGAAGKKRQQKELRAEKSGLPLQEAAGKEKFAPLRKNTNLDPKLRRRIDTYAYKHGCVVTGGKEKIISFLTIFNPFIKDYVSHDFLKLLLLGKGYKEENPYHFCLLDNMEALYYAARFLLGHDRAARNLEEKKASEEKAREIEQHFQNKIPLIYTFLKRFTDKEKVLPATLLNLVQRYRRNRNIKLEAFMLDDFIKSFYILYFTTGQVEELSLEKALIPVKEICKVHEADLLNLKQIDASLFRFEVAYNNLKNYQHQLFPLLLKRLGVFFPESELRDKERLNSVCAFLDVKEEDIITFHEPVMSSGHGEEVTVQKPPAGGPADGQEAEELEVVESAGEDPAPDAAAEQNGQPAQPFNQQFGKLLQILKLVFPGSGIEDLAQWSYILPYFELNIFSRDPALLPYLMNLARYDFVGQVMVLHRILDNMLTSIKINVLDTALRQKNEFRQGMYALLSKWTEAYTDLFLPYLKNLNEYKSIKDLRGRITLSNKIKLEKYAGELRALTAAMLKTDKKEPVPGKDKVHNTRLYELAGELDSLLSGLSSMLKKELIRKNEPRTMEFLKELAKHGVADFQTHSYKPTIKRVKDVLESQYKTANLNTSMKAQFTYFEILTLLARMYAFLLSHPASFYRKAPDGILLAGADEERLWNRAHKALDGKQG